MRRVLFALTCLPSLLLCTAAVGLTVHTHRTWHSLTWRTDSAAEGEKAHASLGSIWREYRACGGVPGQRVVQRGTRGAAQWDPFSAMPPPARGWVPTRQYASLIVADGWVEYRRYPDPTPPFI